MIMKLNIIMYLSPTKPIVFNMYCKLQYIFI